MPIIAGGLLIVYSLWWICFDRPEYSWTRSLAPIAATLVLLTVLTPQSVLWTGLTLASLVVVKLVVHRGIASAS